MCTHQLQLPKASEGGPKQLLRQQHPATHGQPTGTHTVQSHGKCTPHWAAMMCMQGLTCPTCPTCRPSGALGSGCDKTDGEEKC